MTSKFTREELLNIIDTDHVQCGEASALARMALATMDSKPVILYRQVNPVNGMKTYWAELDPEEFRHLKQHTDENAEFMTLYRHTQPAPVVLDGYVMVPKEATLEMIKSGASAASNGMLIPGIYKAMLAAADCSIPMISDRWIPVSEQMPEVGDIVLTAMGGVVNVGETECSAANCRFFTSVISGRELPATHWMPLPAAPQEVK